MVKQFFAQPKSPQSPPMTRNPLIGSPLSIFFLLICHHYSIVEGYEKNESCGLEPEGLNWRQMLPGGINHSVSYLLIYLFTRMRKGKLLNALPSRQRGWQPTLGEESRICLYTFAI